MAWMLLTPDAAERAGSRQTRSRTPHDERSGGADAWILIGDLDAALFQAGVLSIWLEATTAPRALFGGAMSALNAVFAHRGDPLAFRIAWERVRAAHVLADAAVARLPLLRAARNGNSLDIGRLLARGPGSHAGTPGIELHLLVADGFVDATATREPVLAGLVDESLHERATPDAWANALDAAVVAGATRVLVPGIEEAAIADRAVGRALQNAKSQDVEVSFLTLATRQRPGVIGYVLPGLGRADRLWNEGRKIAMRWLAGAHAGVDAAQRV